MGLQLTPVETTFDRALMRPAREPLFVGDRTVLEKVWRVWRDLCALQSDTIASTPAVEGLPQSDFTHDIDAARAEMRRRRLAFQVEELNDKAKNGRFSRCHNYIAKEVSQIFSAIFFPVVKNMKYYEIKFHQID